MCVCVCVWGGGGGVEESAIVLNIANVFNISYFSNCQRKHQHNVIFKNRRKQSKRHKNYLFSKHEQKWLLILLMIPEIRRLTQRYWKIKTQIFFRPSMTVVKYSIIAHAIKGLSKDLRATRCHRKPLTETR